MYEEGGVRRRGGRYASEVKTCSIIRYDLMGERRDLREVGMTIEAEKTAARRRKDEGGKHRYSSHDNCA